VSDIACRDGQRTKELANEEEEILNRRRLGILIKAMKTLREQYDGIEQIASNIRQIADHVREIALHSTEEAAKHNQKDIFDFDLLLKVSLAMDWSLSNGSSPTDKDFKAYLEELFHTHPIHASPKQARDSDDTLQGSHTKQPSQHSREEVVKDTLYPLAAHGDRQMLAWDDSMDDQAWPEGTVETRNDMLIESLDLLTWDELFCKI